MTISLLAAELSFTAIWLFVRIMVWLKNKNIDWKREAILLLMFVNLAVIIRFSFFPRDLVDGRVQPLVFEATKIWPLRINLKPFMHLFDYDNARDMVWNVAGNALMFIPTGIILPILYRKMDSFWNVVVTGAFISLCIEIFQLPLAVRASDIDDLILNSLGVVVGYGVYKIIKQIKG